jgi:hypothetical protein
VFLAVRRGAGPGVLLGFCHHSGADRIPFDVAQSSPAVVRIERAGIVATLPEMAGGGGAGVAVVA